MVRERAIAVTVLDLLLLELLLLALLLALDREKRVPTSWKRRSSGIGHHRRRRRHRSHLRLPLRVLFLEVLEDPLVTAVSPPSEDVGRSSGEARGSSSSQDCPAVLATALVRRRDRFGELEEGRMVGGVVGLKVRRNFGPVEVLLRDERGDTADGADLALDVLARRELGSDVAAVA